jgi:hypothetical protein
MLKYVKLTEPLLQLTMATAPGEFNVCEIIYLPLLTKYVRYEDDCAQCSKWNCPYLQAITHTAIKQRTTAMARTTLISGLDLLP